MPDEAINLLSLAYEMDSSDEICCYYLASAYQSEGDYKKADLFFNAAINNGYSHNLALYYHRLGVNFEQQKMYQEALRSYKDAYHYRDSQKEGNEYLLFEIARVYEVYLYDTANAIENYRTFIKLSVDTSSGNFRFATRRLIELEKDTTYNGSN